MIASTRLLPRLGAFALFVVVGTSTPTDSTRHVYGYGGIVSLPPAADGDSAIQTPEILIQRRIALRSKNGRVLYAKGYGHQDIARNIPVDPATSLFRIGSTSKLFTWTAVMQLVEQGKLSLDGDVNSYLKTFKIPDAYGKPIRIRDLMMSSIQALFCIATISLIITLLISTLSFYLLEKPILSLKKYFQ